MSDHKHEYCPVCHFSRISCPVCGVLKCRGSKITAGCSHVCVPANVDAYKAARRLNTRTQVATWRAKNRAKQDAIGTVQNPQPKTDPANAWPEYEPSSIKKS